MKIKENKLRDLESEGFSESNNEYLYEVIENVFDVWVLKDRTIYIEVMEPHAFHSKDLEIIDRLYKKGFIEE